MALPAGSVLRFSLEEFEDYDYIVSKTSEETLQIRAQLMAVESSESLDEDAPENVAIQIAPEIAPANPEAKPLKQAAKRPAAAKKPAKSGTDQNAPARPSNLDIKLDR